jgi:hypothetical protein
MNDPIKIGAVIAAAVLLLGPYLPAAWKRIKAAFASLPSLPATKDRIDTDDLTMVLDLANRLKKDGNKKATQLAKQLLDAMLELQEVSK